MSLTNILDKMHVPAWAPWLRGRQHVELVAISILEREARFAGPSVTGCV